jgi:pimeloyl-ACP methyl ester carboxylesterase
MSDAPVLARTRLVLVHGTRLSSTQWSPQHSRITARSDLTSWLHVLTPDLPGHGSRADEPFTLDRAIGAIAAAVEAPGPADAVVLAGHSLGGYAATAYAATYPHRLDALVLIGAAAVPRGPGAAAYRGIAALTDRLGPERMTRINDRVLGRLYAQELLEPVIAGGYWFTPTAAAWREVIGRCRPGQLRHVDCPVLVAGGAFDQLMVDARRYARAAPQGRVQVVPRAGHFVGFDQPDAVTTLLVDVARKAAKAVAQAAK